MGIGTNLEEAVGAAGGADLGDDGGAVGVGEVDDGDVGVGHDLVQARPLRLRPDIAVGQRVVHGRGDELLRHAGATTHTRERERERERIDRCHGRGVSRGTAVGEEETLRLGWVCVSRRGSRRIYGEGHD
jgi:hypothetical protein